MCRSPPHNLAERWPFSGSLPPGCSVSLCVVGFCSLGHPSSPPTALSPILHLKSRTRPGTDRLVRESNVPGMDLKASPSRLVPFSEGLAFSVGPFSEGLAFSVGPFLFHAQRCWTGASRASTCSPARGLAGRGCHGDVGKAGTRGRVSGVWIVSAGWLRAGPPNGRQAIRVGCRGVGWRLRGWFLCRLPPQGKQGNTCTQPPSGAF